MLAIFPRYFTLVWRYSNPTSNLVSAATRARLGLSTPPTAAPHALRPHQSIPHNVIQSLRDGRGLLSHMVGCLLLASVVVGMWADSRWWLPLRLAWTTCWVIKWCRRGGSHCASSPGGRQGRWCGSPALYCRAAVHITLSLLQCNMYHYGHFWTSNKILIVANKLRMFKKPNLTSLIITSPTHIDPHISKQPHIESAVDGQKWRTDAFFRPQGWKITPSFSTGIHNA